MKNLVLLLFIGIVGTTIYFTRPVKTELNSLLLENVEALAASPDEILVPIYCMGNGSVDCPVTKSKVETVYEGYILRERY